MRFTTIIGILFGFIGWGSAEVKQLQCDVLEVIPRSKRGYTQGLFIKEGKLYESTGGYGSSLIRRFDLKTQAVEVSKALPKDLFGEGLTPWGEDQMIQLTWKKGIGIIYDQEGLNIQKIFRYPTEGWGITAQENQLVMSDGSAQLYFLNPENLQVARTVTVRKGNSPVSKLNELEWVEGAIYANVWLTENILKIDPKTGQVLAEIDCSPLQKKKLLDREAVLNGIAYDSAEKVFYLTGKKWPNFYKVRFIPMQ